MQVDTKYFRDVGLEVSIVGNVPIVGNVSGEEGHGKPFRNAIVLRKLNQTGKGLANHPKVIGLHAFVCLFARADNN